MLIKLNARNQITLSKSLIQAVGQTGYFDVEAKGGQIVLTLVRFVAVDAVRTKLVGLGITEIDTTAAVNWSKAKVPTT